jgi:hypothetical protein
LSDFTVELRPHKGMVRTKIGMQEKTLPQDVVIIHYEEDGEDKLIWAGYVSHNDVAGISLIVKGFTDEQLSEIKEAVDALRAKDGKPPTVRISQLKTIDENQYRVEVEDDAASEDDL